MTFDQQLIYRWLEQHSAVVETAIEQALQGGTCGVLAVWVGLDYRVSVCEHVPYGQLYTVDLAAWTDLPGFMEGLARLAQREGDSDAEA